jgi:hypothetical protein
LFILRKTGRKPATLARWSSSFNHVRTFGDKDSFWLIQSNARETASAVRAGLTRVAMVARLDAMLLALLATLSDNLLHKRRDMLPVIVAKVTAVKYFAAIIPFAYADVWDGAEGATGTSVSPEAA